MQNYIVNSKQFYKIYFRITQIKVGFEKKKIRSPRFFKYVVGISQFHIKVEIDKKKRKENCYVFMEKLHNFKLFFNISIMLPFQNFIKFYFIRLILRI